LGALAVGALFVASVLVMPAASASPVCTDGYMGGPSRDLCGGRVFPEAENAFDYVQMLPDSEGFREYQHGLEYLAQLYPRWVSVFTLRDHYNNDDAVSVGFDRLRSYDPNDTGDGHDILVAKLTDHQVSDKNKQNLLFSLSIHGDEKGGLEGGVRVLEDMAMAAENGGAISDGVEGYDSTTGITPEFHEYEVKDLLKKEAVYFVDFNPDGWAVGDRNAPSPSLYTRGNRLGVDLNRQMPTIGRINQSRNPLQESEMYWGHKFMHEVASKSVGGKMAYGADIHGESQSRAFVDIMYPAGQFDSVKHRQLMAIAERTKSVIDATLYEGLADALEEATGGDIGEGIEDQVPVPANTIPTKPARWGTVWDTLGYTDTGFVGDYLASELGVTGMDYEIAFNHADTTRPFGRPWSVVLQENYINATRAIVKTAMAYTMYQSQEFKNFSIDPGGKVAYLANYSHVTDRDKSGPGRLPGPLANGIGQDGKPVEQKSYRANTNAFFNQESKYVKGGITGANPADIANDPAYLDRFDTLFIADRLNPFDRFSRSYNQQTMLANIKAWVERGGNLVLTDGALHALSKFGVVPEGSVENIEVYQPYANFVDLEHPMVEGLRPNARQLAEATLVGYGIGPDASPMTVVNTAAFEAAGGHVVGTTTPADSNQETGTSVGELPLGAGKIRILGGGLPTPTETQDHRYGLKNYALTYSGLFILENSMEHDAANLGNAPAPTESTSSAGLILLPMGLSVAIGARRRRRS
jgi:hypothetical protein